MSPFHYKALLFYLACMGVLFTSSCAQTSLYDDEINIIITPHKLSVHSGSEDKIFVQILDKQGGPLFGMKIKAMSATPAVATITPEALTDAAGKTSLTVKGISPGTTSIVLSAAGKKAVMEVIFLEH